MTRRYDVVVVGAGSAGCVVAARLSEEGTRRVALVEAGPDFAPDALPDDVRSAVDVTAAYDWGYHSEPTPAGNRLGLIRGRLVGGSSAVNACFALRGDGAVYDEWAALGNDGWSFDDVLATFVALETDHDRTDPWHGSAGPVGIRRYSRSELSRVQSAFVDAAVATGHPFEEDLNRPGGSGVGHVPMNAVDGVRQSAALTHLDAARGRPNFEVISDAEVDRVMISDDRATGVRLVDGRTIDADEVVLCAGAYGSPAVLLRSGVGPSEHLRHIGVDVVADVPGVGENLVDHPVIWFFAQTAEPAAPGTVAQQTALVATSSGSPVPDLQVLPRYAAADGPVFIVDAAVMRPQARGTVRLVSADPRAAPAINPRFLSADADVTRMVEAIELGKQVLQARPLADLVEIDFAPAGDLAAYAKANVQSYLHPVGTCRMGPRGDDGAVVDAHGRVHGIGGLSVIDASVMPTIPTANTNLPTMMLAEHLMRLRGG